MPTSPAVANAIANATGVRIKELPLTPERVLRAIHTQHFTPGTGCRWAAGAQRIGPCQPFSRARGCDPRVLRSCIDRATEIRDACHGPTAGAGDVERSRDWMDQAEGDLRHARSDLQGEFYDWACFSAQQAAEKAVKAVFQRMGAEAWGHSVADLLGELGKRHTVPERLREAGLELDKAYIPARYPNAHPSGSPRTRYTRAEATRFINHAAEIVQFCSDLLSQI